LVVVVIVEAVPIKLILQFEMLMWLCAPAFVSRAPGECAISQLSEAISQAVLEAAGAAKDSEVAHHLYLPSDPPLRGFLLFQMFLSDLFQGQGSLQSIMSGSEQDKQKN